MDNSALSLIPAAVTIGVALGTRRIAAALGAGVAAGALVAGRLAPLPSLEAGAKALASPFLDPERMEIILFILLVGGLLEVLAASGAFGALAEALERRLDSGRKTRLAAWGLSMTLFFDDYANVLITGSSLRSVARRHGMSPAMLAWTIDVVAVLASVMLVSTWAAFEGGVLAEAAGALGVERSATELFLGTLPFHLYTYLAILLTLVGAITGRWIGARLDTEAGLEPEPKPVEGRGARARHVVAPLVALVATAIGGIFAVGLVRVLLRGEPLGLMRVVAASPTVKVLIGASLVALALAALLLRRDRVLTLGAQRRAFGRGLKAMAAVALIIVLASALSRISTDLGSGAFLAGAFTRALPAALLPLAVYVAAMLVTVSTGFSWGSMTLLVPVGYQIALGPGGDPALLPIMGAAAITGAVAGEHLIPYSEKAVLTAYSCGITPVYHLKTQLPQSALAFLAGGAGFAMLGYGLPWLAALGLPAVAVALGFAALSPRGERQPQAPAVHHSA